MLDVAKKMDVNLSLDDVSRTHRVRRVSGDNKKPRAIICRFTNWRVKSRFIKARPALKKTKIFISDDLTQRRSHIFFMSFKDRNYDIIIGGDMNIDLLKIKEKDFVNEYFDMIVSSGFFHV